VEWSTDYVLLGQGGRRELVSVKHRDPGQHDWTFGRLKAENVFRDLHAVWSAMAQTGDYFFESNAGFEAALRPFMQSLGNPGEPDTEATRRLADCLQTDINETRRFMQHFCLRAEPLPSRHHIDAVATQDLGEVMGRLGLNRARVEACFAVLTERIAAASTQRPPDPAHRVDRLVGFMQDLAAGARQDSAAILTMEELREIVREASRNTATILPWNQADASQADMPDDEQASELSSFAQAWAGRAEPAYHETLRVIRNRTKTLIDRQRELAELQAFATGDEEGYGNGYLWLSGAPWAGKTALLAEAIQMLSADEDHGVVAYFLIARESQASVEQFLSATVGQLAWILGINSPSVIDVHVFRDLWARAAHLAKECKGRLLLVVDGLDEDVRPGGRSVTALMPTEHLGKYARVLISSRPHPEIPIDVESAHPLRAARVMTLANSPYASQIRILAQQEISAILSAGTNAMNASDRDLAFDTLGLLTAAAGALSVEDISTLLGTSRREVRAFLASRIARSVEPIGAPRERYNFAHQTLLEYCIAHPDIGGERKYIDKIHDWAESWKRKGWPNTFEASTSTPTYLLDSYPSALARDHEFGRSSADRNRLGDLVSDERWIDTAIKRVGNEAVLVALHNATKFEPQRKSIAAVLRVVEHQAQHPSSRSETSSAWTITCLAWDAFSHRNTESKDDAVQKLHQHDPPLLIPSSMSKDVIRYSPRKQPHVKRAIRSLTAAIQGWLVSAGGIDGTIQLWDPAHLDAPSREIGRHNGVVLSTAVTEDGLIVSGGLDGRIRLWDPSDPSSHCGTGRELGRCKGRVRGLAVTPDKLIVSGGDDSEIWLWDPVNAEEPGRLLGRHENEVRAVAVTADGIIVSGSLDGTIRLWDRARSGGWGLELGRHGSVMDVAILSGHYVASVGLNGSIRLWDARRPTRGYIEMIPDNAVRSVATTSDGHVIFGCGDGSLGLWNPAVTGNRGLMLGAHPGAVGALATASDCCVFAANHHVITAFRLQI
jgi:WD40 repeat protein